MHCVSSGANLNLVRASIAAGQAYLWNGPVCSICGRGYDGSRGPHQCAPADLRARIAFLQAKLDEIEA